MVGRRRSVGGALSPCSSVNTASVACKKIARKSTLNVTAKEGAATPSRFASISVLDPRGTNNNGKMVFLDRWAVKLINNCEGVYLEGYKKDNPDERWLSTVIIERLNSRTLSTLSGSIYCIEGGMDVQAVKHYNYPRWFLAAFKDGFPPNWLQLCTKLCTEGYRPLDVTSFTGRPSCLVASDTHGWNNISCKESVRGSTVSLNEAVEEMSQTKKLMPRKSLMPSTSMLPIQELSDAGSSFRASRMGNTNLDSSNVTVRNKSKNTSRNNASSVQFVSDLPDVAELKLGLEGNINGDNGDVIDMQYHQNDRDVIDLQQHHQNYRDELEEDDVDDQEDIQHMMEDEHDSFEDMMGDEHDNIEDMMEDEHDNIEDMMEDEHDNDIQDEDHADGNNYVDDEEGDDQSVQDEDEIDESPRNEEEDDEDAVLEEGEEVRAPPEPETPGICIVRRNELIHWVVKPLADGKHICVEGLKKTDNSRWHSTQITNRISSHQVTTASGTVYILHGPMEMYSAKYYGLPRFMRDAFKDGFPENWEDVLLTCSDQFGADTVVNRTAWCDYQLQGLDATLMPPKHPAINRILGQSTIRKGTPKKMVERNKSNESELRSKEAASKENNSLKATPTIDISLKSKATPKNDKLSKSSHKIDKLREATPKIDKSLKGSPKIDKYCNVDKSPTKALPLQIPTEDKSMKGTPKKVVCMERSQNRKQNESKISKSTPPQQMSPPPVRTLRSTPKPSNLVEEPQKQNKSLRSTPKPSNSVQEPQKQNKSLKSTPKPSNLVEEPQKQNKPLRSTPTPSNPVEESQNQNRSLRSTPKPSNHVEESQKQNRSLRSSPKPSNPVEELQKQNRSLRSTPKPSNPVEESQKQNRSLRSSPKPSNPVEESQKQNRSLRSSPKPSNPVEELQKQNRSLGSTPKPTNPVEESQKQNKSLRSTPKDTSKSIKPTPTKSPVTTKNTKVLSDRSSQTTPGLCDLPRRSPRYHQTPHTPVVVKKRMRAAVLQSPTPSPHTPVVKKRMRAAVLQSPTPSPPPPTPSTPATKFLRRNSLFTEVDDDDRDSFSVTSSSENREIESNQQIKEPCFKLPLPKVVKKKKKKATQKETRIEEERSLLSQSTASNVSREVDERNDRLRALGLDGTFVTSKRSGRLVKPPLASWAGQRVVYDTHGNPVSVSDPVTKTSSTNNSPSMSLVQIAPYLEVTASPGGKQTEGKKKKRKIVMDSEDERDSEDEEFNPGANGKNTKGVKRKKTSKLVVKITKTKAKKNGTKKVKSRTPELEEKSPEEPKMKTRWNQKDLQLLQYTLKIVKPVSAEDWGTVAKHLGGLFSVENIKNKANATFGYDLQLEERREREMKQRRIQIMQEQQAKAGTLAARQEISKYMSDAYKTRDTTEDDYFASRLHEDDTVLMPSIANISRNDSILSAVVTPDVGPSKERRYMPLPLSTCSTTSSNDIRPCQTPDSIDRRNRDRMIHHLHKDRAFQMAQGRGNGGTRKQTKMKVWKKGTRIIEHMDLSYVQGKATTYSSFFNSQMHANNEDEDMRDEYFEEDET